jgi:hypothetical protein
LPAHRVVDSSVESGDAENTTEIAPSSSTGANSLAENMYSGTAAKPAITVAIAMEKRSRNTVPNMPA